MEIQLTAPDLLKSDKAQISDKAKQIINAVRNGELDKTQAYIFAKKVEAYGKELIKDLKPLAEDTTIQKGGITMFNADISQSMQGVGYSYDECGDLTYNSLIEAKTQLDVKIKEREKFLQSITSPTITGDIDTGESWEVKPAVKTGKLGLVIKLK